VSSCGGFHLHTSKKYKIEEEEERPSKLKKKQQKTTKNKTQEAAFSMHILVLRMNDFLL